MIWQPNQDSQRAMSFIEHCKKTKKWPFDTKAAMYEELAKYLKDNK